MTDIIRKAPLTSLTRRDIEGEGFGDRVGTGRVCLHDRGCKSRLSGKWMGMSPKRIETLEAPEIELLENLLAAQADCEAASTPSEQGVARKRWMAASERINDFVLRGSALRSGRRRSSTR